MYSYASIMRAHKLPAPPPARDQPLDAADLTRRLTAHLTAQETAQRRRSFRSRMTRPLSTSAAQEDTPSDTAATAQPPQHHSSSSRRHKAQPSAQTYHHIPTHSALSFARTATPDPKRIVHKLSAPVLREHLRRADESGDGFAGSVQRAREIDRARRERQERGERNAWQWGRDMDAVREGDERRGVYRGVRRDFEDEEREGEREREGVVPIVGNEVDKERHRRSFMGFEGRGDWAQQEDRVGLRENKGKKGLREIIRLFGMGKRKAEKEMVIRTSTAKQDSMRLEKLTSAETETESEGGRRSRRSSLFTRLKWHSSHAAAHES